MVTVLLMSLKLNVRKIIEMAITFFFYYLVNLLYRFTSILEILFFTDIIKNEKQICLRLILLT